ncbi:hypothetical protein GGR53DRAFT_478988 [Hypoxylon sp. FL1150]|nr:hypothetical protein GGR53DRAFT_478988 [Hypoxylon sp. FL1150]
MAAPAWETLFPELKAQICEIIYHTDPQSLVNLARANKDCYAVAALFLFRTIKVFVRDRDQLQLRVQYYTELLHHLGAQKHVRRLVIYGPGLHNPSVAIGGTAPELRRTLYHIPDQEREDDQDPLHCRFDKHTGVDIYDNIYHSSFAPDASVVETAYELDDGWSPLAELVRQLPVLGDVIYQCAAQFPPCLLKALHERQPEWPMCRLHLDTFKLRCLSATPPTADPHELRLIRSPCLHSITIRTGKRLFHGPFHWVPQDQLNMVFRLVAGFTPNIKEVHVIGMQGFTQTLLSERRERSSAFRPRWEEQVPIPRPGPEEKGSLSYLHLVSDDYPTGMLGREIDDWSMHTDFTVLRTLKLDGIIDSGVLETLVNKHEFPSLESLAICLNLDHLQLMVQIPVILEQYFHNAEQFLSSLPGLRTLRLRNWMRRISLEKALGSNLRTLWLEPTANGDEFITKRHIAQIREQCPLLEDLTLVIRRSKGNSREIALYRELGTLPKLQHLSLILDPLRGVCGSIYKRESGIREIRNVFINSALDDTLALAIFEVISEVKERRNLAPLEKLEIRLIDAGLSYETSLAFEIEEYIAMLGLSWRIMRMPRDITYSGPAVVVRQINKKEKRRTRRRIDENIYWLDQPIQAPFLEAIFRSIWPQQSQGSFLKDDWRSQPLSTSTTRLALALGSMSIT